ncbi:MAG: hypothetical protein JNN20_19225 [Betaproteobacteria bacterium]|nr:hypothetical protein [Betaproteobacteria bacterium]
MRTHLEFRSNAFPAQDGEDELVNPGRWGKLLADYLRAELDLVNLSGGEPFAEDWGWLVPIDNEEFDLWVGCGNYEEYADGFLCFIEPSKPFVRKFFRKIETTKRVEQVAVALETALRKHSDVRDLKWWTDVGRD